MRNPYLLLCLLCLAISCRHKTLNEQLAVAFTTHLKYIDADAQLDSVRVLWSTPVNEKLIRTIDDTVYVREYNRIKWQLVNARLANNRDSVAFYTYEVRVLEHNIDSISKSIGQADTTRQHGSLLACAYYLTRRGKQIADSTFLYLDSAHTLKYTWYMDSSIAKSSRK
jgi:hypothetical protein